ncbi:unnamed protein product [Cyclocybe aegerita]|uniref:MYND-type domain-containing protein n=1 Tax=Cyclocybe aegerita TaxID=1973307 RepID=A0A8S0X7J5_CYCAE|nr:unnamed protein product [Cyclocybe aegerita]
MEPSDPKKCARPGRDEKEKEKMADFAMTCSHCLKIPEDKKCFQKCARCKSMWYCSRECQKLDWPFHRRDCCETQPQFSVVIKFIHRVNKNDFLMKKIRLAVVHEMKSVIAPTDKPAPDPTTTFLNIGISISLRPTSDIDLEFIRSRHTTPEQLKVRKVWGVTRFTHIVDMADLRRPLPEEKDTYVAVLHFNYNGKSVYYTDVDLHPNDIGAAKMIVVQYMVSDTTEWGKPGNAVLRCINSDFAQEEKEGKKPRCIISDDDKDLLRRYPLHAAE